LRFLDQLLGEEDAARLRDGDRRHAEMLVEQAAQLAFAHAKAFRKRADSAFIAVETAFGDQRQRTRHRVGRAAPGRGVGRDLGPASEARAEAGTLRRRGTREEAAILALRRACWADRPAIDAGRGDADEEPAVETRIARRKRAIADVVRGHFHRTHSVAEPRVRLAIFGRP